MYVRPWQVLDTWYTGCRNHAPLSPYSSYIAGDKFWRGKSRKIFVDILNQNFEVRGGWERKELLFGHSLEIFPQIT